MFTCLPAQAVGARPALQNRTWQREAVLGKAARLREGTECASSQGQELPWRDTFQASGSPSVEGQEGEPTGTRSPEEHPWQAANVPGQQGHTYSDDPGVASSCLTRMARMGGTLVSSKPSRWLCPRDRASQPQLQMHTLNVTYFFAVPGIEPRCFCTTKVQPNSFKSILFYIFDTGD